MNAKGRIRLNTPLDFASTPDIIGGNSGSPVVNKTGQVVGIIFDGNIQSLPGNFYYDEKMNRAISVDSRGILEALRSIYGATRVAEELAGTKAATATTATSSPVTRKKDGKAAPSRQKAAETKQ
jgi:S1-C subfamily serine protease